jgi:hypothetical protein
MFKQGLLIVGVLFCLDLIGSNNGQSCPNLGGVDITGVNFTELVRFLIHFAVRITLIINFFFPTSSSKAFGTITAIRHTFSVDHLFVDTIILLS